MPEQPLPTHASRRYRAPVFADVLAIAFALGVVAMSGVEAGPLIAFAFPALVIARTAGGLYDLRRSTSYEVPRLLTTVTARVFGPPARRAMGSSVFWSSARRQLSRKAHAAHNNR